MGFTKKYEREIMESEEGKSLYARWSKYISKNNDGQEFATFLGFYQWAMEAGYTLEAQLYRLDSKAPYSPDNCQWITAEKVIHSDLVEIAKKWNATVNRIRRYYGMEPLRTRAETCPTEVEDGG